MCSSRSSLPGGGSCTRPDTPSASAPTVVASPVAFFWMAALPNSKP